ncbi:sugar transferase [Nocardia crassostreae]|uniref:sugar transferase n=1 Tax=Nocardia crassostreae TaxID=53428 RepID=UPI0009FD59A0|nr:sugar transferase [Nocardia crassostreae]
MVVQIDENQSIKKSGKPLWLAEYRRRLRITDSAVIAVSVALAQFIRFGGSTYDAPVDWNGDTRVGYTAISVALVLAWVGFLAAGGAWSPTVLGSGAEEYRRLVAATMRLFGLIAIVSLLLSVEFARGYLAIALPIGLLALAANRLIWRKYAVRQRRLGRYLTSVLVVGRRDSARQMRRCFERDPAVGYSVVGVYIPYGADDDPDPEGMVTEDDPDAPLLVTKSSIIEAVRTTGADSVAIAATEQLGAQGINELLWKLSPLGIELVVTPGVVDIADQRLSIRPVSNLPLLHIEKPQYDRARSYRKAAFDIAFAAVALLLVAPVMLATAFAVKLSSPGPIFYKSSRIGLNGKPFRMIKFRSMRNDADRTLPALLAENEAAGPLFKMRTDPRVTPVGRILRKFSLDELPQFINVLRGEMSVVGPRPPLPGEVEDYDWKVRRRLLVKPGLTGLWQVSSRSDLPWDEAVRLDLSYVENWSMMQDLLIIKKTITAVARSTGAY